MVPKGRGKIRRKYRIGFAILGSMLSIFLTTRCFKTTALVTVYVFDRTSQRGIGGEEVRITTETGIPIDRLLPQTTSDEGTACFPLTKGREYRAWIEKEGLRWASKSFRVPDVQDVTLYLTHFTLRVENQAGHLFPDLPVITTWDSSGVVKQLRRTTDENGEVVLWLGEEPLCGNEYVFTVPSHKRTFKTEPVRLPGPTQSSLFVDFLLCLQNQHGDKRLGVPVLAKGVSDTSMIQSGYTQEIAYVQGSTSGVVFDQIGPGTYKFEMTYGGRFWEVDTLITFPPTFQADLTVWDTHLILAKRNGGRASNTEVILFDSTGQSPIEFRITDTRGRSFFGLLPGLYKPKVKYRNLEWWFNAFRIPGPTSHVFYLTDFNVLVTKSNQGKDVRVPVSVHDAFTGNVLSAGTTGKDGNVVFGLADGEYTFQITYDRTEWKSPEITVGPQGYHEMTFNFTDFTVTIPKQYAVVPDSVPVYVYDAQTGRRVTSKTFDPDGSATFGLADGRYEFEVSYRGTGWLTDEVEVGNKASTHLMYNLTDFTVYLLYDDKPRPSIPLSVYNSWGGGSLVTDVTDDSGRVSFSLPEGSYKIKEFFDGREAWSNTFVIPDSGSSLVLQSGIGDLATLAIGPTEIKPSVTSVPDEFFVDNYWNPFAPLATIRYEIPVPDRVSIKVYDMHQRLVRTLINHQHDPGLYTIEWDGTNNNGKSVPSGVYTFRIRSGSYSDMRSILILDKGDQLLESITVADTTQHGKTYNVPERQPTS